MSTKNRLITNQFKTKKGVTAKTEKSKSTEPVPSTSSADKATLEKDLELLKEFDLNWEYGPSTGITRLERWNRAEKYGLNPSLKVKELVLEHPEDERYTLSVWNAYKNII